MDMTKPLPQRRKRASIEIILGRSETLAVLIAALTVAFVAALPDATLWKILVKGGLSQDLSILAPPAPSSAHLALAMVVGGITGLFALVAHRVVASIQRRRSRGDEAELPARRRADSHPDAPPRPPLMASRDLPPPPPTGIADADRTDSLSGCVTASPVSQNGTTGGTSLQYLLFRFERGLSRRIAVCEAQIASAHLTERMIFAPGAPTMHSVQRACGAPEREPQPTPRMPTPANDLADAVEMQLETALLTLRRLTEQGRR